MQILPERNKQQDAEAISRFARHATQDGWWLEDKKNLAERKNIMVVSDMQVLRRYGRRLICPKCERAAFRHMGGARCNHCGWEGPSVTVDEYINQKLYRG